MIMKCEHCGKNEATFYYKSNINGNVTEHHLCSDCARELGYADSMEKSFSSFGRGLAALTIFSRLCLRWPAISSSLLRK